jgi:hypothetical protein
MRHALFVRRGPGRNLLLFWHAPRRRALHVRPHDPLRPPAPARGPVHLPRPAGGGDVGAAGDGPRKEQPDWGGAAVGHRLAHAAVREVLRLDAPLPSPGSRGRWKRQRRQQPVRGRASSPSGRPAGPHRRHCRRGRVVLVPLGRHGLRLLLLLPLHAGPVALRRPHEPVDAAPRAHGGRVRAGCRRCAPRKRPRRLQRHPRARARAPRRPHVRRPRDMGRPPALERRPARCREPARVPPPPRGRRLPGGRRRERHGGVRVRGPCPRDDGVGLCEPALGPPPPEPAAGGRRGCGCGRGRRVRGKCLVRDPAPPSALWLHSGGRRRAGGCAHGG